MIGDGVRGTATLSALVRLLARFTPYVESEVLGLAAVVHPGDVCVDVGAAYGCYTLPLAALVGAAGRVHSVEPLADLHPVTSWVFGRYAAANIRRHPLALGARPGGGVVSVPVRGGTPVTGRSFLTTGSRGLGANAEFADHREVVVRVETLDRLCAEVGADRLDFVKADVEGAELAVLHGGSGVIEQHRPTLLLEIERRHTTRYGYEPADVVCWLAARGYRMHAWYGGRWRTTDRVSAAARNYLFVGPNRSTT